jgi:hypothetical protein
MRMQDKIKIKPDLEWQSRLSGADRAIFALVAGQMLRRYDYARDEPRAGGPGAG